ncbi:MAG: GNAT family N-acetyltransferase [Gammaproteobacteria bacterium]
MPSQKNQNKQEGNQVPTTYACMPRPILRLGNLWAQAVQEYHIESIRQWRNAQMDILRQSTLITPEEQKNYFQNHIWPDMRSSHPKNILLAYMEDDNFIGYGGLVHIAWEHLRAEVSFLLKPTLVKSKDDYSRYFSGFLEIVKQLAFQHIGLERLFTETYAVRTHHISILEATGFSREGLLQNHVKIDGQSVDSIIHGCLKL